MRLGNAIKRFSLAQDAAKDTESELMSIPKTLDVETKKKYYIEMDRTIANFDNEINSMVNHEHLITRPRLGFLMKLIYMPKFRVKTFASYVYAGENDDNYNDYSKY